MPVCILEPMTRHECLKMQGKEMNVNNAEIEYLDVCNIEVNKLCKIEVGLSAAACQEMHTVLRALHTIVYQSLSSAIGANSLCQIAKNRSRTFLGG